MHPTTRSHSDSRRFIQLCRITLLVALISGAFIALAGGPANNVTQYVDDKLLHFLGAAVLGLLLDHSFPGPRSYYWRWQAPLLLSYGILIEIAQGFTAHRVADVYDVLANAAGLLAYGVVRSLLANRRPTNGQDKTP